jgi:hypothetical protein
MFDGKKASKLFNIKEASSSIKDWLTLIQQEYLSISEIKTEKNSLLIFAYKVQIPFAVPSVFIYNTWILDLENKTLIQSPLSLQKVSFDKISNLGYAVDNKNCVVQMQEYIGSPYRQVSWNGSAWVYTSLQSIAEKSHFLDLDCMWTSIIMYGTGTINLYDTTNDRAYPVVKTVSLSERGTEIGINKIGTVFNVKFAMLDSILQFPLKYYKIKFYPLNKGTVKHDTSGGND